MTLTRRILFGAAASWFSRGLTILLSLILLPVLFRTLPKEELGIWLLLGQTWATLGILDLGFGVTLTRRIAFAKGRGGIDPSTKILHDTLQEIADLLATGTRIYRVLAAVSLVLAFSLGAHYLTTLPLGDLPTQSVWISWAFLCFSFALTTWATPWACLLQGVGYVGWDALLTSFVSALTLIGQIIAALLGGGVISLAAVAVVGAIVQRFAFLGFARRRRPDLFQLKGHWSSEHFREMRPLALRAWITAVGASMILYTDSFVIASLKGPGDIPAYRAAWVLIHNVTIIAVAFAAASSVFVSQLWQKQDLPQIHRLLTRHARLGWLVMLAAATVLLFAGETLFSLWLGPGQFVGLPLIIIFLVTETLETQTYILATTSRATGQEAFALSSLVGGLLKIVLSVALAAHLGLFGVALGTLIALAATNHWYVPWQGLSRLRLPRIQYLHETVLPCFIAIAPAIVIISLSVITFNTAPLAHLIIVLLVTSVSCMIGIWSLVLDAGQRTRVVQWLRPRSQPQ